MASQTSAMRVGVGKCGVAASSEASAAGDSSSPGMTRVYMGGLGGGVTEADIEKTFAPLGRVSGVEIVRSKGRALAFMDFEPNSEKSLAKLFATYNGCIWKGGKLRLEKAKEHYLNRLRREWAEDAEPTKGPIIMDMSKSLVSSDKSKSMAEEKVLLKIFLPKLRKVKALPFKGTGKHKYSFQRIVAPSLPVHFCDCEEHYVSPEDPNQDQVNYMQDQTVVVNEEEINIMNSVINKLLEKEADTNVADGKGFSAAERDTLDDSNNETQSGDSESAQQLDADVDNLVTNIGLRDGEDVLNLMELKGWDAASADEEWKFGIHESFHDQSVPDKQNIQKRQITGAGTVSEAPHSKRNRIPSGKSKQSNFSSMVAGKIRHLETEHEEWDDLPAIQSQRSNYPTEDPDVIESETAQSLALGQSAKGTSWIQKSSWKELVGDGRSSTFAIAHVLPGVHSSNARLSKSDCADNIKSSAERTTKPQFDSSHLKPVEVGVDIPAVKKIAAPRHEEKPSKKDGIYVVGPEGGLGKAPRSSNNQEKITDVAKIGPSQACAFMRSDDSIKEWTKAKAALSGHLKKKMKKRVGTSEDAGATSPR